MGRKVLVDTNIAIGYIGNRLNIEFMDKLDTLFNLQYHISEEAKFNLFIDNSIIHEIDNETVNRTIKLRKTYKIKLPDALIAATCLVNNLSIITLNTRDFEVIKGLQVITPATF